MKKRILGIVCSVSWLGAIASGCGGDDKSGDTGGSDASATGGAVGQGGNAATGGSTVTGGSTATGGSAATGGTATTSCDLTPCEGRQFGGQALSTCCQSATACGITLANTCLDPSILGALGDSGTFGQAETVVLDPTCPDQAFDAGGLLLKGCCDRSGFCGSSTEGISIGFPIPTQCVTPQEAAAQFGQPMPDAAAQQPCQYPSDAGPSDASADVTPG